MSVEGARIRVKFASPGTGRVTRDGQAPNLFDIAGEDQGQLGTATGHRWI